MKKYYLLGIGGISMSALAVLLKNKGEHVCGSDDNKSRATEMLEKENIEVDFEVCEEKIKNTDIVVCSSAIKENHPLYICAKKHNKKILTRGELLGELSRDFDKVVAVAGSHGKTTTTAMIYEIFKCAGYNPTLHLGGFRTADGKNYEEGGKLFFVTEACEYCDNFLNLNPYLSVITNVEKEHTDYFKTFERQLKSFEKFKCQSEYVIDSFNNFRAKNIRHDKNGGLIFSLYKNKDKIMNLHLQIAEEINTQNCIYAYQVAKHFDIPDCIIKLGLESYKGVSTRFEKVGCKHCDVVVCDYAHHPTEINKAIKTAQKIYKNRHLITIFQPHTYSRTKSLLQDFVFDFKQIEIPLFFKTYSAREKPEDGMSAKELSDIIARDNTNAQYFDDFEELQTFLLSKDLSDKVLLFLGAGDLPAILHKNNFIS